jgi:glutamate-ammonia-ligase adenylyltransferase
MDELTLLAEGVTDASLRWAVDFNLRRFGEPAGGARLALIALGKLGGEELNYSSDIDLMAVYGGEDGQTTGVVGPSGVRMNRVGAHEFYTKTVELLGRLLSTSTGEGIVYRVDLRLRPQGQKGEIALPLGSYGEYYLTWGRTWERMALIRARPVAGDGGLGLGFMQTVEPFVWRGSDYSDMEEIRALKKKIDSSHSRDDIKRGSGGIREVEFFIQTFQLIYGPDRPSLRTHRLLNAMQALRRLGLVPGRDLSALRDNYLFLRRLEHCLQMKDDLQTHTLPSSEEAAPLAKKMGFPSLRDFISALRMKRLQVRSMYNSLLGAREDVHAEALSLLEGEMSDEEIEEYLSFRGLRSAREGAGALRRMREQLQFRTSREVRLARGVLPELLEKALRSESPDRALAGVESFFASTGADEARLTALADRKELMDGLIKVFALSSYLTRALLSDPLYFGLLIEEGFIRKTLRRLEEGLERHIRRAGDLSAAIAGYRRFEEARLGMFYLLGVIDLSDLHRYLSHMADAAIRAVLAAGADGLSVIAMGKLGGREMTYGSDIDIIFVAGGPAGERARAAEAVIKKLTSYTDRGVPYSVDLRLRPDGSRGILVNDVEGYGDYYLKSARGWEIQALLKARPVCGDPATLGAYMRMAREAVIGRAGEIGRAEVVAMRKKIIEEASREREGLDLKLGPGGIEEIEFYVQRLQLENPSPDVLVQGTGCAIRRLERRGFIGRDAASKLMRAYRHMRGLETFLRLNDADTVLKPGDELAALYSRTGAEDALETIRGLRREVLELIGRGPQNDRQK